MVSRRFINLVKDSSNSLPDNKKFANDIKRCIETIESKKGYKGSNYYKPSSLNCMRQMYFIRTEAEQDISNPDYQMVGMADTGTHRHEFIQDVLCQMKILGFDWEYVKVCDYLYFKKQEGKCTNLRITGTKGYETHLVDDDLKLSFMCDGIIKKVSTNEYFLFEFKNVTNFKFNKILQNKKALEQHMQQVTCYCNSLDLDKVFLTYEDRNLCDIEVPEIVEIDVNAKQKIEQYLRDCEEFVTKKEVPPKTSEKNNCNYCQYKEMCRKV